MEGKSFWQRLRTWVRQDIASYLYQCPTATLLTTAPPPFPGLDITFCDHSTLATAKADVRNLPAMIEERVQLGDMAILATRDDEWIFRSTAVLGPKVYPVTGYPLELQAHEAYLECAETLPAWRGKGVAPGMLGPTAQALLARDVTTVYLLIDVTNASSYRAAEKGGAQRIGIITSRRRYGQWVATFAAIAGGGITTPIPGVEPFGRTPGY